MFKRWLKEYSEFFFAKGNALDLAIAVVVGRQFQQIVDSLTQDLLMPLLNPLVRSGNWEDLVIPYYGGALEIGKMLSVLLNSLLIGWAVFFLLKLMNRMKRMGAESLGRTRAD